MQNLGVVNDQRFEIPRVYFSDLDADVMAAVIAAAADLALVLDSQGVIRDISLSNGQSASLGELRQWMGRKWIETVTVECRVKIKSMLEAVGPEQIKLRTGRQVNHPLGGGLELPVSYSLVPMGAQGLMLALGRDLRAVAAVQQRLVDAQQSIERDYLRLRHTEARYRMLFEAVDEVILVVDATSLLVFEHNRAAANVLGEASKRIAGRSLMDFLAEQSKSNVYAMTAQVRSTGRSEDGKVRIGSASADWKMAISPFKQDSASMLLVRLSPVATSGLTVVGTAATAESSLLNVVNAMPDAFVLTDVHGQVLSANKAFSDLLQLPEGESVLGQSLDQWLGRSSVDLSVLIGNLRQHGVLRLFSTTLRSEYGEPTSIEISAVAVMDRAQPCLGFTIRDISRRLPSSEGRTNHQLPRSADQLTGLVGRLPLKEIVGETTDLIERMCIEAALALTRDNRASAAEMLGLSRQSLYVKLRRFGIQETNAASSD